MRLRTYIYIYYVHLIYVIPVTITAGTNREVGCKLSESRDIYTKCQDYYVIICSAVYYAMFNLNSVICCISIFLNVFGEGEGGVMKEN